MKRIIHYFSKNYLPRWLVFAFDLTVVIISWFIAFLLRFNFDLGDVEAFISILHLAIILPVFITAFWRSKSFAGILRHSTPEDVVHILSATLFSALTITFISFVSRKLNAPPVLAIPYSIIIIHFLLVSTSLVIMRLLVKLIFQNWLKSHKDPQKIMIYGAGWKGKITLSTLLMDTTMNNKVIGFIDDNTSLSNKYISGVRIYSPSDAFSKIIPEHEVTEIILAIDNSKITKERKREITDECLKQNLTIKEVPAVKNWINGELQAKSIRPISIEDLLGRSSILLDRNKIEGGLKDSVVLVTGAAGSIGSEIVRQLISFKVKRVVLFDKAESDLYNLQQEILAKKVHNDFVVVVGDVTNPMKLRRIFTEHSPTIVFNAAAYKHVPLMEEYPSEAVHVNVGGTKILADLSIEFGVQKFVFISTDKAVNPTNVMGATKRISEMYIQSLVQSEKITTQFIITRFGNVLGSNGSVVPLFKKQIENGGPITITHRDITRYFMTIPEACQLVLEAGFMGKGGEIFVFDMGEPIKIYDLAKKMILLSGFVPEIDIKIKTIGLRPGEKLYEELLSDKEALQPTHNEKIMIGKVIKHDLQIVNEITDLLVNLEEMSREELVEQMMRIVPEFISMNSHYSNGEKKLPPPTEHRKLFKKKTRQMA
ncbi:NDP-sugar epimerase, includes UDP-GlcNAc-inverting 4,6-dehydratase FlaA1 and capsular polysaccharide biosynthesis protein EpsC [Mariniphaga anaerophila]|uniref:NDP-sugar epimerase, includes UDP-GlcNAc-inverting 4,6-dehydratase FlaA1 and capsular polysaccharide biosynthesis protein EpsC n=1 Tax=Mariniphaga anaerophila TaxID=1484053 RepID=A0A1M5BMU6_9BACT|nr:nucleoside-diphosphate sugar epimerase/dehydratase [Mariniphaga anaerophila]SHF43831.1 NDP-sugar epimerase, includes UDP-GlcNAc-inverting 4,6-dehydratase FlaA1 and capsular polysaccharide biosynthesis protein EpsC [Mariniphaga anaerophila]